MTVTTGRGLCEKKRDNNGVSSGLNGRILKLFKDAKRNSPGTYLAAKRTSDAANVESASRTAAGRLTDPNRMGVKLALVDSPTHPSKQMRSI